MSEALLPRLEDTEVYRGFFERLKKAVDEVPSHLLREEDIRRVWRAAALASDEKYYSKSLNFLAQFGYADLMININGIDYYIEMKLWHSTLKLKTGAVKNPKHRGVRSASKPGLILHVLDLLKLRMKAADLGQPYYFVSLTQAEKHHCNDSVNSAAKGRGPFLA